MVLMRWGMPPVTNIRKRRVVTDPGLHICRIDWSIPLPHPKGPPCSLKSLIVMLPLRCPAEAGQSFLKRFYQESAMLRYVLALLIVASPFSAFAGELPKEGSYDYTSCWSGVNNVITFS